MPHFLRSFLSGIPRLFGAKLVRPEVDTVEKGLFVGTECGSSSKTARKLIWSHHRLRLPSHWTFQRQDKKEASHTNFEESLIFDLLNGEISLIIFRSH